MSAGVTTEGWETVHTVAGYWDGPRSGVADHHGVPHAFECGWSDEDDDWSNVFKLSPIGPEAFAAVMESWAIWRRWREAFEAGVLGPDDKYPVLAAERERYEALTQEVDAALRVDGAGVIRVTAEFRGTSDPVHDLQVRWSLLGEAAA